MSNDVSDDVLAGAFNKYPSFQKARVIRDRLSQKVCATRFLRLVGSAHKLIRQSMASLHFLTPKTSSRLGRRWMVGGFFILVCLFLTLLRKICWKPPYQVEESG